MTSVANTSLFKRVVNSFTNLASSGPLVERIPDLRATIEMVGSKPSNLYGYFIYNPNATEVFIKFWDQAVMPVLGVDQPVFGPLQISAGGSIVLTGTDVIKSFEVQMWVGVSTDFTDPGNTIPVSNVYTHIIYKQ